MLHSAVEAQLVEKDLVDGGRERAEDPPVEAVDAPPSVLLHASFVRRAAALARRREGRVVALNVCVCVRVSMAREKARGGGG